MKSKLDYWEHTFNIAWGCTKVSPACDNCYAEEDALDPGHGGPFHVWGYNAARRTFGEKYWKKPLEWNKEAEKVGIRKHVFCSSMADVFEKHPTIDAERKKLWPLIQATPNLDWGLITKRHDNVIKNLPWGPNDVPWSNVWIGMTVEDEMRANIRLPYLVKVNAVVRFVIMEPLLSAVPSLPKYLPHIDWVLVGGESCDSDPAKARPMQPDWAKAILKDCQAAGVPFRFKQWGSQKPVMNADSKTFHFEAMNRFKAGRVFLKQEWNGQADPKIGKAR